MEKNLRPVVALVLVEHRKPRVEKSGVFHCWGSDYEEFDVGGGTFTAAVIEFPDGTVELIRADMVRFTDITPEAPE